MEMSLALMRAIVACLSAVTVWIAYLCFCLVAKRGVPRKLRVSVIAATVVTILLAALSYSWTGASVTIIFMLLLGNLILAIVLSYLYGSEFENQEYGRIHTFAHWALGSLFLTLLGAEHFALGFPIEKVAFENVSSTARFPAVVCEPDRVNEVVQNGKISSQVWMRRSSFETNGKSLIIEVPADINNRIDFSHIRSLVENRDPTFVVLQFHCEDEIVHGDDFVMLRAKAMPTEIKP